MAVYSSIHVQGTEFISLTGDPLPSCLNTTEPHVVGSGTIMRPAVVKKEGALLKNSCLKKTAILISMGDIFLFQDGLPLVCGGTYQENDAGCYSFYPGKRKVPAEGSSAQFPGTWTERGSHNSSTLP